MMNSIIAPDLDYITGVAQDATGIVFDYKKANGSYEPFDRYAAFCYYDSFRDYAFCYSINVNYLNLMNRCVYKKTRLKLGHHGV